MIEDFTTSYDLYKDAILRYCLWKSNNRDVGQDLMQETFLRFWICLRNEKKITHTRAFLYRIAHNLFVSHIRKKKEASLDQLLETGYEPVIDPWEHVHDRLDAERPIKVMQRMRPALKKVLRQRFIQGLPPTEIAVLSGETPNTISVRIFQGLKKLRSSLEESKPDSSHLHLALPTIL